MEDRVYFVIDMKSFFASVECAERNLDAMTTNLVVADKDGNSLSETLVTGSTLTIKTSGSTTYYLYSKSSGLNIYSLTITI